MSSRPKLKERPKADALPYANVARPALTEETLANVSAHAATSKTPISKTSATTRLLSTYDNAAAAAGSGQALESPVGAPKTIVNSKSKSPNDDALVKPVSPDGRAATHEMCMESRGGQTTPTRDAMRCSLDSG